MLNLIVTAVCQRSSWSSGAIMAADEGIRFSVLVARFAPLFEVGRKSVDKWAPTTSPIRTVPADRRPIVIEDAQKNTDLPGYRREAVERDYHTVVLLPFSTVDELERGLVLSVHAHEYREVDQEEMASLEIVALLGSLAVEKARLTARLIDHARVIRYDMIGHGGGAVLALEIDTGDAQRAAANSGHCGSALQVLLLSSVVPP